MSKTPPLVVIGTVAIDELSTPFGARQTVFGGSASFFSYAASFFARVGVVAVVGEDFPEEYRDVLKEREIDLSHLDTLPGKTFHWKGKYESDMNSAITLQTDLNVLLDFKPKIRYEKTPEFVFLANIDPDLQLSVLDQMHGSALKFVACDTMNFWIQSRKDAVLKVLGRVHAVFMNDGGPPVDRRGQPHQGGPADLQPRSGIRDYQEGEHGALLYSREGVFIYPAYPLETVYDPTGAGDSFAGGVMGYLASARKVNLKIMKTAIAYGTVVASFTVEKFGMSRLREVKREHFDKRLEVLKNL